MKINAILVFVWLLLILFASLLFSSFFPLFILFISSVIPCIFVDLKKYSRYMLYSLFAVTFIFIFNTILMGVSSLMFSATMTLRLLAITSSFAIFSITVDFEHMILLLEKLKFPQKSVVSLSLSLRFFPVAMQDAERIKETMLARGVRFENKKLKEKIKERIPMFSSLFLLSLERSIDVAESLELQGFPSERRRVWKPLQVSAKDKVIISLLTFDFFLIFYSLFFNSTTSEIAALIPASVMGGFYR